MNTCKPTRSALRPALFSLLLLGAALGAGLGCAGRQTPRTGLPDDDGAGNSVVPLIDEREYRTEPAAPQQARWSQKQQPAPEELEPEVLPIPPEVPVPELDAAPERLADPAPAAEAGPASQGGASAMEPAPAGEAQSAAVPYAGARGAIRRAELVHFLDRPPAMFLRNVSSEPHFEGGRFRGWTLTSFYPGDQRFAGIDLRQGDVILRVNGHPIEQPDQFIFVWQELRQAKELRVDLLRSGKPHVSRWTIAD